MQSTFYRVCKLLIHYGSFILQDLSNRYVTRKIDMCVVVGLIKYHQINVSLEMSWIIQQLYSFWHIFLQLTYLFTVFIWVIDIFLYYLVIFLQIFILFSNLFTDSPTPSPTAGVSTTSIPVIDVRGDNSENPEYEYDYEWVFQVQKLMNNQM